MELFDRFLESNRLFWREQFAGEETNGWALIDSSVNETYLLYGVTKVGLVFSSVCGLRPLLYPGVRTTGRDLSMLASMSSDVVSAKLAYSAQFFLSFVSALKILLSLKTAKDVLGLTINGANIGTYLYDHCCFFGNDRISLRGWARIFYGLIYFYMDEAIIRKIKPKLVVIGDPATRGFLFELCRLHNIKCVNAVNVYTFQMHKYFQPEEFDNHFRAVSDAVLEKIPSDGQFLSAVNEYFERRFNGGIQTHDVIKAYAPDKIRYSKDALYREYRLKQDKPLVVVMAACFSDAPHVSPHMLYDDYEAWLSGTVSALLKNKEINFLVKEHPCSSLYNEEGIVAKILTTLGCEHLLLKSDVHNHAIVSGADYAITCAGTVGLEMTVLGKPVVLAARPPYARKGFTVEPPTRAEYEQLLSKKIHEIPGLNEEQVLIAKKTAFVLFELYNNYRESLELGKVKYVMGEKYDLDVFYENVITENSRRLKDQEIYRVLSDFLKTDDTSIVNYEKLCSVCSPVKP